jgi:hypothetical protein
MSIEAYYITTENSEDRLDSAGTLQEAIRIARELAREGPVGDLLCIEHRGKHVRQLVRRPDGRVEEEELG